MRAVFARVHDVVPDAVGLGDAEYVMGLRATVAASVDFSLAGIEYGEESLASIPVEAVAQAKRAARSGVSLDMVLRRYMVGQALLWDYIMQEADRVDVRERGSALRGMLRAQSMLLDRLVVGVAREHGRELNRAGNSRERHLSERVRTLLNERWDGVGDTALSALGVELGYDLEGQHLGVIARGAGARQALRDVAASLDRRLLSVACGEGTVWAWLGGPCDLRVADCEHVFSMREGRLATTGGEGFEAVGVCFAVGEPAWGLEGWRLTHRQAQAALVVALHRPRGFTRYADVVLLAAALTDGALARALIDIYISPLEDSRSGGVVLCETLRAYLLAERNVSSAAAALGVARKTVESRLRTIEERLGRTLHPCPAELEVALRLQELDAPTATTFDC